MKARDDFIKKILENVPDMKVLYINNKTNERWPSEKPLLKLTEEEKNQFNLRRQFPNEIILDIEEKYRIDEIKRKLAEKKWSYKVWDTGSRGYHISIIFENLSKHKLELRNRIRKFIINYFGTDEKLANEKQWLALEWTPHFKTGERKRLVDFVNVNEKNRISEDIIKFCRDELIRKDKIKLENKILLKDYANKDPYLKYVMNNVIERGDRNNVLFKNLAIGLVRSGLTREQIIPYAEKIVLNCPGKNLGEFMGWVDKALTNQILDYNKTELVQWSKNHGHPVLYKLESEEDLIDYMSIKQLWNEIWNHTIVCQPVWKDLCFYNMLGTVVKETDPERDLRVHVIFSCDSGSGKDEGINLVKDVLDRLGYKTKTPNEITDKTLVGGVNPASIEFNIKHQLTEFEPVRGTKKWKNPVEKGFLEDTDWIAFPEAEFVFKPGVHNKRLQSILRQAMDKRRRVSKGVALYEVEIKTNTSFIMTTYSMDNIINSVLHNGLFQRCLFYNKHLTQQEHNEIRTFISKKNFNGKLSKFNKEKYMIKLVSKLKHMKKWYDENKNKIEVEEGSAKLVNDLWIMLEKQYSTLQIEDIKVLDSIVRRSNENIKKLTILDTVSKMKLVSSKQTIKDSFKLASKCVESVKDLILRQDKGKKRMYIILKLIQKGNVTKGIVSKELEQTFNMTSPNTRTKFISSLIKTGYVTTYKIGHSDMLSLTEKGRNFLEYEE